MKFTTTTVALLSTIMAKITFATFNYGIATFTIDKHQDHAIWVNGESACSYAYLGPNDENPCLFNGGWFQLDGTSYRVTGCGGDAFCLEDANQNIIACAVFDPQPTIFGCGNEEFGPFSVTQQYHFGD